MIQYSPADAEVTTILNGKRGQTFIFFKHATFKKAAKECIEGIKNENTKAQFHRNIANLIEKQETSNQFMW